MQRFKALVQAQTTLLTILPLALGHDHGDLSLSPRKSR